MQSVLVLLPFQTRKPSAQPPERLRRRDTESNLYPLTDLYGDQQRTQRFQFRLHNRLKQIVDLRCLLDGKLPFPFDNRLAVGAGDTDILGRFIEAQPKLLHADCAALHADKNQIASTLDVGSDDDDLPEQVPGSVRILRLLQFSKKIPQHRDLPGGLRFHHVIQAVFLRQLQPSCALCILRCQNIAGITQLVPCQLQLLSDLIQRGDVLLPEHPAAAQPVPLQKRIIAQMDGIHPHLPQLIWRQSPPHGNRHILGAKCLIRDLDRQTRCLKKFVVSEVGLDQPALNAAFKDARKIRHCDTVISPASTQTQ